MIRIIGPIANLKGRYFQPSLSVCVSVCLCVSERHFYPPSLTDFGETWSQGPYSDLLWAWRSNENVLVEIVFTDEDFVTSTICKVTLVTVLRQADSTVIWDEGFNILVRHVCSCSGISREPSHPNSCLHSLLPTLCDPNLVPTLRAGRQFPALASQTKKYQSFINFGLLNYQ